MNYTAAGNLIQSRNYQTDGMDTVATCRDVATAERVCIALNHYPHCLTALERAYRMAMTLPDHTGLKQTLRMGLYPEGDDE